MLWAILAALTGAAVLSVLWPLSAKVAINVREPTHGDVDFYAAQLAEIDQDKTRGLLNPEEAAAARLESERRLLRAAAVPEQPVDLFSEPALRRRRAASALALSVVPIVGLAVYGALGSPQMIGGSAGRASPEMVAASPPGPSGPAGFPDALRRVEDHLAANPSDVRGWEIVGPIYLRLGRYSDAAAAFRRARQLGGDTVDRLNGEGEALVGMDGGRVPDPAKVLFQQVLSQDPASPSARYHLALAAEQGGEREAAVSGYRGMIEGAPADAPWLPLVHSRLARLDGKPAPTLPAPAVTPEIAAMVSGLDERLKANGGSEAEWLRLVRSLAVLGRRDYALDRVERARAVLAGDGDALQRLDAVVAELGLRAAVAQRNP